MASLEIAIVTMDRPSVLKETLKNLESEKLAEKTVIIDGSKGKKTASVCEEFDVDYYEQESNGMTAARNEALEKCSADNLVFIDDDTRISETWFQTLQEELEEDSTVGVTGKLEGEEINLSNISNGIRELLFGARQSFGEITNSGIINGDFFYEERKNVDHMPGCNMAYDVETLKSTGGFSEEYDVGNSYREDTVASYQVSQKGNIIYNPKASVDHLAIDEEGDEEKWMFYNPYLTRYFLADNRVISGKTNLLRHISIQAIRHFYFLGSSLLNFNFNYFYYLKGELYGIWDFLVKDKEPREVL
jgi:GT2 family glycosyltransferase